jgi:peptidoglycan/LPS O-acetylase OafA/YrhL
MGIVPASLNEGTPQPGPHRRLERPKFRPDIEGLRGVAILLVVAYHAGVPGFGGGYVGVDVFFVLSGYLITWLLVREAEAQGSIDLAEFYARRARRLFPALAVALFATLAASYIILSPLEQLQLWRTALATAMYASNIFFAFRATDYLAADAETDPLLHTWSLAVEEQFYFVWPLIILFGVRVLGRSSGSVRRDGGLILTLVAVTVGTFALSVWLTGSRQPWAFFSSPTRAWEFGIGGLAALLPSVRSPLVGGRGASLVLGWLGAVGVAGAAVLFSEETLFPGTAALLPAVGTVLVLRACAGDPSRGVGGVLSARPLRELGRLSYSWYLWHWPVLVLAVALAGGDLPLHYRLALLVVSLGLAEASYRFVEDPIRHNRVLSRRPAYSLGMGVAVTAAGVLMALGLRHSATLSAGTPTQRALVEVTARPEIGPGCVARYPDVEATGCVSGDETSDRTVVLFGDSHAEQWFPAFESIAQEQGWRLVTYTKWLCPPPDVEFTLQRLGRVYHECGPWRQQALQQIVELQPEAVFVANTYAYGVGSAEWEEGARRTLTTLSAASGQVVQIRPTPHPGFHVPECLSRAEWRATFGIDTSCDFRNEPAAADARWEDQVEAAQGLENVFTLDMTDRLCVGERCPAIADGIVLYRDDNHITTSFAEAMTPVIAERIGSVIALPSPLRSTPATSRRSAR